MVPVPQELPAHVPPPPPAPAVDDHRVVISGISGLFPNSHHVKDLSKILYERENPITDEYLRWTMEHPELPKKLGKIPDLKTFDAQFFGVHYRLSNNMDPMSRKLLEQTYQALYDAGLSPDHLSKQKIGVFIGCCFSESEKALFYSSDKFGGFAIAGCSKAMFANRISYWLNAKGPSMNFDSACCSSIIALEKAYVALNKGDCDAAIVGGASICLDPRSAVQFGRVMHLCMDGKTKCFDKDADGAAKSESISVMLLQKAKDALRIYAHVCYVDSNFEPLMDEKQKQVFGPQRDPAKLTKFLKEFYDKAGISPNDVEYVEAYGSASPKADKSELQAIERVFCNGRSPANPLLIGSVMSNIGYTEAASGIAAITKVLLGYHTGKIAGNLHLQSPREDIPALIDGRIKVVTEHQPIKDTYFAVNSLSYSGMNAHVLLHGHNKPKDYTRYQSSIPHLVPISARKESSVQKILEDLETRPVDPEEIALLHNIHEKSIQGHLGRGFTILGKNEAGKTVSLTKKAEYFNDTTRPLWFVYSGMGSQWPGMGTQLMKIPIFAAAIERCHKALEPKGLNIIDIISSPIKTTFDNILHSFVGIAAVQIGLTDILQAVGIKPDMIIGHSVGELGCAYADGCFTAEEMILAAYYRGLVSVQTPFIKGSMAAVGLGYNRVKPMCPPEIEVACHNGPESSTISGPADIMKEFVSQLSAKGVFAKEVPCSNIAYHSRYIKKAGPELLKHLSDLITNPKARSERWVSTSVPQDKWGLDSAKFSSAEYHTNNLLGPVLFEETSRLVPPNAVLIEIAPHGLLQAILKRSLPAACVNIPLTRRSHDDNVLFILEALGQLYIQGFNLEARALYPNVEFPVSTGTPMLSHLVEWAHQELWNLYTYRAPTNIKAAAFKNIISVYDNEHEYLKGHVIKNEMRYPYAAALVAVWDTLAMTRGLPRQAYSVRFRNVYFYNQPKLVHDKFLSISVQIQKGNGFFEVMDKTSKIASGYVTGGLVEIPIPQEANVAELDSVILSSKDVYKMLFDRQMHYRGEFRSIQSVKSSLTQAHISWTGNWVTFLDSFIQLNALRENQDGPVRLNHILSLTINMKEHNKLCPRIPTDNGLECLEAKISKACNVTSCGGVVVNDITFVKTQEKDSKLLSLKLLEFVPHFQHCNLMVPQALNLFLQMVNENLNKDVINVFEILSSQHSYSWAFELKKEVDEFENFKINFKQQNEDDINLANFDELQTSDLIIAQQITSNMHEFFKKAARRDIFFLTLDVASTSNLPAAFSCVVASAVTPKGCLILSKWRKTPSTGSVVAVTVTKPSDFAVLKTSKLNLAPDQSLLILSKYPPLQGLRAKVQKWRKLYANHNINVAMIDSDNLKNQNFDQLPNFELAFNFFKDGVWGGEYFVQNKYKLPIENPIALRSRVIGELESLYWEEVPGPEPNDIAVKISYAGLNYRDAGKAIGSAPIMPKEDFGYGLDFSGVTLSKNKRVMGLVQGSAASSIVKAIPSLLWPIPPHWTMEDAATVPLPYAHAFYLLDMKSSLAVGSTILVHGAAGGLGQAVLSIALARKCIVYATVSDLKKKIFLRKLFPEIQDDHIGNSRDTTFMDMVLNATNGEGCQIVISCLPSNSKDMALHCCGKSGITLDTHQITANDKYTYGMFHMTKERSYVQVDFSSIFRPENAYEMKKIHLMVSEGIAKGYVRPLSRVCYQWNEAARALRLLAASKHYGRALLNLQDADPITQPKLSISHTASQIVVDVGSNSTLACQLVDTLVERGAKNVTFHADDNAIDGYVHMKIKSWINAGIQIILSSENLADITKVEKLANTSQKMGPIESVFVVCPGHQNEYKDNEISLIVNNLDTMSRKLCDGLKYFAILSKNGNVGREVCLARANNNLAASLIILPSVEQFENTPKDLTLKSISSIDALCAMEKAVKVGRPVTLVNVRRPPAPTLLQHVSSIAGLTLSGELKDDHTLDEIVADSEKLEAIASHLADKDDLTLSKEDVAALSIRKLREIENNTTIGLNKESKGLGTYFSYVDSDEIIATVNIVPVATLTHQPDHDEVLRNNEANIVLIPGFDGHYRKLESFSQRLKLPAFVLQGGCDNNNESLEEMALRFSKIIMKHLKIKDAFYLLGYSFGALVALEVASHLEKRGYEGVVFCIDAEPDTFKSILKTNLGCSGAQLEDAVIQHMYSLMVGENSAKLEEMLKKASSWQEKMALSVRELRGKVPHSTDYAGLMIETAYARIQQALKYDGKQLRQNPLRSQIMYLRSTSQPFENEENIGLAKYSQQPLTVYDLTKDHAHALEDLRTANIINQHLDKNILETFSKRNLCEPNFFSGTKFYSRNE